MAKLHWALTRIGVQDANGESIPITQSDTLLSGTVDVTASSAVVEDAVGPELTTFSGLAWVLNARGGDVEVSFGKTPDADTDHTRCIQAGASLEVGLTVSGEGIAVRDAT